MKLTSYIKLGLLPLLAAVVIASCKKDEPETETVTEVKWDTTAYVLNYGSFPDPQIPADNSLTKAKVYLGRLLFFDKRLSNDLTLSCASCHKQEDAFSDIRKFSVGTAGLEGGRQAMAVFNLAWHKNGFFWDGRAPRLRDQALLPIQDPLEMNETLANVVAKVSSVKTYQDQFKRAFGSEEVTSEKISLALEQYMFTLVSMNSKYDQYLAGSATLTDSEERGRKLFFDEFNQFFPDQSGADCAHCHSGPNFTNDQFMNNGLDSDAEFVDLGLEKVTGLASDRAKFKVPSLRNIDLTPPYMHDGRFATLEQAVDHYNSGVKQSSTLDGGIQNTIATGLMLSPQDKADLVAFMKTLTDQEFISKSEYSDPNNPL
ncbi:c-type cytochrome [bacterium SCSIO 12741]|nr:c-type cytochrome [bacterium SCSIO 12741]